MLPRTVAVLSLVTVAHAAQAQHTSSPVIAGDSDSYAADVLEAARRDYLPIRVCYDATPREALDRIHSLSLVLSADGTVRDVRIDPSLPAIRRFRGCISPILRAWHLPAPASHSAVVITYPFDELRHGVDQAHH